MKNRIFLGTEKSCLEFCNTVCNLEGNVSLVNSNGKYRVNAKSILGCLMVSAEWGDEVYVEADNDYYSALSKWIVDAADDAANIHE